MANRRYKNGNYVGFTAAADLTAGDVVTIGDRAYPVDVSSLSGELAEGAAIGEYLMDKTVGASEAIAKGVDIFWDESGGVVTISGPADGKLGQTSAASTDDDLQQRVLLGP